VGGEPLGAGSGHGNAAAPRSSFGGDSRKLEDHHRFLIAMQFRRVEATEQDIAALDRRSAEMLAPTISKWLAHADSRRRPRDCGFADRRDWHRHERFSQCSPSGGLGWRLPEMVTKVRESGRGNMSSSFLREGGRRTERGPRGECLVLNSATQTQTHGCPCVAQRCAAATKTGSQSGSWTTPSAGPMFFQVTGALAGPCAV
jgi:hypothetical protein